MEGCKTVLLNMESCIERKKNTLKNWKREQIGLSEGMEMEGKCFHSLSLAVLFVSQLYIMVYSTVGKV